MISNCSSVAEELPGTSKKYSLNRASCVFGCWGLAFTGCRNLLRLFAFGIRTGLRILGLMEVLSRSKLNPENYSAMLSFIPQFNQEKLKDCELAAMKSNDFEADMNAARGELIFLLD